MKRGVYYLPVERGFERELAKRVDYFAKLRAKRRTEEVIGPGVVGETPTLRPGEAFEYTSFCPLRTPFGTMHGTYQMTTEDGEEFDAEIAQFELSEPLQEN